jgi:hypothetical protein
LASREEKNRRDTRWGPGGLQRLDRLAKQERRSGAEIARQALIDYEVSQSYFRDTVRCAALQLFQALVYQEEGWYGDPASEEATPADKATAELASLLNSIYAAQGMREAFEMVLDHNRMTRLDIPSAVPSSDLHEVGETQDREHQQESSEL